MQPNPVSRSLRRYQLLGVALVFLLVGGIGGWAAYAQINGAVVTPATVVVEGNSKLVQHRDGGIVANIMIKNGDKVSSGDVVIALDDSEIAANHAIIKSQIDELETRQARLEAERDGADTILFPPSIADRSDDDEIERAMAGQVKLFNARKAANAGQKDQLNQQIEQLSEQINGLSTQREAMDSQLVLIESEVESLSSLLEQGLTNASRVMALRREAAALAGQRGDLTANMARTRSQIGEVRMRALQIDQDSLTEVLTELRQVQAELASLYERRAAVATQLARIEIRAPIDGVVHQLNVHTVGGVIAPREPIMAIVPESAALVLEARVEPQNIDQITVGQAATVRLPAFNAQTTPELNGEVVLVSADLIQPTDNTPPHYLARILLTKEELERLQEKRLIPGMPAEAYIQTGARSALSYLIKPISDQMQKVFRES
ncbi:MAG: HlyD family type I secretion periplasmic adaptor subunit [Pseudomonadota bacterium]